MTPRRPDGSAMPRGDELKLYPSDIRAYLHEARAGNSGNPLPTALVAEGSMDNKGVAKPSDLYFTAGQQKFLQMMRTVLSSTSRSDICQALEGPWKYESKLPSLMWDISDAAMYSLVARDPSKDKKLTNPGAEALAILGLSLHPVFAGNGRTLTQGCSGKSWKESCYSWPLWEKPASPRAVRSLLAHGSCDDPAIAGRRSWFRSWGIAMILRSSIHRSDQGGSGTFAPPAVVWQSPI